MPGVENHIRGVVLASNIRALASRLIHQINLD
jgi:hypothetical protein